MWPYCRRSGRAITMPAESSRQNALCGRKCWKIERSKRPATRRARVADVSGEDGLYPLCRSESPFRPTSQNQPNEPEEQGWAQEKRSGLQEPKTECSHAATVLGLGH